MPANLATCSPGRLPPPFMKLKILVEGQRVEQITQFKYLGSIISSDGYCEKDIRSRIVMGKQAFGNKKRLLTGNMNLDLKKIL